MKFKPEKLYRIRDIMKLNLLPFGYRTLQRKVVSKEIPSVKIKGGGLTGSRYYIKGKDIDNYLNKILNGTNETN